jgi:hypothetical protein
VHIIRMKFVRYGTFVLSKVQNPEIKPGTNVLLFPGFVLSKVQKDNNIFNNIVVVRVHLIRMKFVLFVLCTLEIRSTKYKKDNGSYPDPTT